MTLLVTVLSIYLISAVVVGIAMKRARAGVEDESGFHYSPQTRMPFIRRKPVSRPRTKKAA